MGLASKTVLQFKLPATVPGSIFEYGIQKLSSNKNISDERFIIYQLISYTPPVFWEQHLQLNPAAIIDLFCKTEEGYEHTAAIGMDASRFPSPGWAALMIEDENRLFLDLIVQLSPEQKEKYLLKHFEKAGDTLIQLVGNTTEELSVPLSKAIFKYTSTNPNQFTKTYYRDHIHLIPAGVVPELTRCTPSESYPAVVWGNTCDYLRELLSLKEQIHQSFKS